MRPFFPPPPPEEEKMIPPWFYPGFFSPELPPTPPKQKNPSMQPYPQLKPEPRTFESNIPRYPLETPSLLLPTMDSFSRDCRYLESMYPDLLRRLRFAIQEELSILEHEHSFLYDEYPDKLCLRRLTRHLAESQTELAEEFSKKGCPAEWFEAFVELLLVQQLLEMRRHKSHFAMPYTAFPYSTSKTTLR